MICDGFDVSLQAVSLSETTLKYGVMTYVSGKFEGKWLVNERAAERKFMRPRERFVFSAKVRNEITRKYSKRLLKEYWPNISKKISYVEPIWPGGKSAIDHLCRVCESVEIAPDKKAVA